MAMNTMPSNVDINVALTIGQLIGQNVSNCRWSQIVPYTVPSLGLSTNLAINPWDGYANYDFFNFPIQTANQSWGTVSFTYPWSETSATSSVNIGSNRQSFDPYVGNIDVSANAIYPKTFWYWHDPINNIFWYTAVVSLSTSDSTVINNGYLRAYFK